MDVRRLLSAAGLCCVLAACSGGEPSEPAATLTDEPSGLVTGVVQDARNVVADLEQRQADLESLLP